jgi:hypothetical protein
MIGRLASLVLDTMSGMRWLLPVLLAGVAVAVLWSDGPLFCRWLRRGERVSAQRWIRDNFWILIGFAMALYLAWHYPHNPL